MLWFIIFKASRRAHVNFSVCVECVLCVCYVCGGSGSGDTFFVCDKDVLYYSLLRNVKPIKWKCVSMLLV